MLYTVVAVCRFFSMLLKHNVSFDALIKKIWSEEIIYDHNGYHIFFCLFANCYCFGQISSMREEPNHISACQWTRLSGTRVCTVLVYHGRQTDESSMSIFGEIGGVFTRVDSMWQSGVELGDRFGYIWLTGYIIWCFGWGIIGVTGDRPFDDQADDGDWRCWCTAAAAAAATATACAFIWFGDWIWMAGRCCCCCCCGGGGIELAEYCWCICIALWFPEFRSMWFMQLFKCLMIGTDVSWSITFKKLDTSAAQWRNPALNFSAYELSERTPNTFCRRNVCKWRTVNSKISAFSNFATFSPSCERKRKTEKKNVH